MSTFVPCVVSLIVVATCVNTAGAYSYVVTSSTWTSAPDEYFHYSSTRCEEEYQTATASEGGASCTTETFAAGMSGDDASASAVSIAETDKDWEWDGPAGTAPGGSQLWYYAGDGYSQVSGVNAKIQGVISSGYIRSC